MNYIDCHSHLLPGVDDGAWDMDESLRNLRKLRSQGVTRAIITPHVNSDYIEEFFHDLIVPNAELKEKFSVLQTECGKEPDKYPALTLGSEFYYDPRKGGPINPIPMGESGYVLLELPYEVDLDNLIKAVNAIRDRGYKVILAHPEKYHAFIFEWDAALPWLRENPEVKVQIEAYDTGTKKASHHIENWRLIESRTAHVLGTDSHGDKRPPVFDRAVNALLEWAGEDPERLAYVRRLTRENAEEMFGL